jgi:hypothetical protein
MSPEVKESETLRPVVERANEWLRPILDSMPEPVVAEWHRVANSQDGEAVSLRLSNEFGSAVGVFRIAELSNQYVFHHRLNGITRALLRTSSHELMKLLREAVGTGGE